MCIARGRCAIQYCMHKCIQKANVSKDNKSCMASMQAGAGHALRRAGGAGAATTVSAPAALHTVGQRVRAQGNRDEFTGVNRDVLGRVHRLGVGSTAATSQYLPPVVLQIILHGLPWVLFVHRTLSACRFEPMLLQGAWAAALPLSFSFG